MTLENQAHKLIADGYLSHGNAARAAKDAGFKQLTSSSLSSAGRRVLDLPEVQEYLSEQRALMAKSAAASSILVRENLRAILSTTIKDYCSWDKHGVLKFVPSDDLTIVQAARIKRLRGNHRIDPDGGSSANFEIELFDSIAASRLLADIDGLNTDLNVAVSSLAKYGIYLRRDNYGNWEVEKT